MKAKRIGILAISLLLMTMAAGTAIATAVDVGVDIKPYSQPNSINVKANGVIPVAILGSSTFDVNDVNLTTVRFAAVGAFEGFEPKTYKNGPNAGEVMAAYEDANGDGITDLVLHFDIDKAERMAILPAAAAAIPVGQLTVTAETFNPGSLNGAPIAGLDSVRLLHVD